MDTAGADGDARARRPRVAGWSMVPVAAVVVLLDQLTKWWALERLSGGETIDLFWTLRLRLVFNPGTAFSLASSFGPLLGVLAVVVVVLLVRYGAVVSSRPTAVALGMVLGGALGNLADRAFRRGDGVLGGYVVDFVDLQWWPVFNVADAAIVLGAVFLALATIRAETGSTPVDRTPDP